MFSNQEVEFSLGFPCRRLSAVAPPPSSLSSSPRGSSKTHRDCDGSNDNDDGAYDDDNLDEFLGSSYSMPSSPPCHRFLVGSSFPSSASDGDEGDGAISAELGGDGGGDDRTTNRLCVLRYREDSNEMDLESSFVHPGEVWALSCHPSERTLAVTCGGGLNIGAGGVSFQTKLWRVPESSFENDDGEEDGGEDAQDLGGAFDDDFMTENRVSNIGRGRKRTESSTSALGAFGRKLETVVTIPHGTSNSDSEASAPNGWNERVGCILWNPVLSGGNNGAGGRDLITVGWNDDSPIALWDVSTSVAREVWSTAGGGGNIQTGRRAGSFGRGGGGAYCDNVLPRRASWDPHDTHVLLVASGPDIVSHDLRCPPGHSSAGGVGVLRAAHRCGGVADLHHDALKPHVVATSGMDGTVKFWDLRVHLSGSDEDAAGDGRRRRPMATLLRAARGGHSHWASHVAYNACHDQLVLSAGTDGVVNLWRMSSCSSAPLLELEENDDYGEGEVEDEAGEEEDDYFGKVKRCDFENGNDSDNEGRDVDDEASTSSPATAAMDSPGGGQTKKKEKKESSVPDIRVARHECADGAADVAWCTSDPWLYASLSCDGDVVVHHVPSKEKYKILL